MARMFSWNPWPRWNMGWTYERANAYLLTRGADSAKLERNLTINRISDDTISYVHSGNELLRLYADGSYQIISIGKIRCWGNYTSKTNQLLPPDITIYHHCDKTVDSRWLVRVNCYRNEGELYQWPVGSWENGYHDGPVVLTKVDGKFKVNGDVVKFNRAAEIRERKRKRVKERRVLREAKARAEKKLKRAGLRQDKIMVKSGGHTPTETWIKAWVCGQIAVHPAINGGMGGKTDWRNLSITYIPVGVVASWATSRNIVTMFRKARRVEDKLALYVTCNKLGVDTNELRNQLRAALGRAA